MLNTKAVGKKNNSGFLIAKKKANKKITILTCYDYPTAVLEDKAGIDIVFVGDSVGTNVLGYESETDVTLEDMIHHLKAVQRGVTHAYLLVDMPYGTHDTPDDALKNANTLISHGANGVKLEGGQEKEAVVQHLAESGIEVCCHLGLNPQIHGTRRRVQGKTFHAAKTLIQSALALQDAGARMIVFELIPEELGRLLTQKLRIPTIGIGAGRYCDGQVLIINDLLGITPFDLIHAKKYQNYQEKTFQAISNYKGDVENHRFPVEANVIKMDQVELTKLEEWGQNTPDIHEREPGHPHKA